MLTFIHAADFHLDSPLRGLARYEGAPVDEIRESSRRALGNLVDYILDNNIPLLLIAGDLYDADCPDFQTLLHFSLQMDRLKDAGTRVALIRGNHDAGNTMTRSLKLPDNVKVFRSAQAHTWRLDDLGVAVHAQSYKQAEILDNLVRSYPDPVPGLFNIGLLHTSLSGRPGHSRYAPCDTRDLLVRGYDYWALGHVHRHEIVRENPYVIFPGCIQGRHVREGGPRGCMRVDVDDMGTVNLERIILDVFRWKILEIDITGLDTFDQVLDRTGLELESVFRAESEGRSMAVRVLLKGVGGAHEDLIMDRDGFEASVQRTAADISRQKIWIEKITLNTFPALDFEELKKSRTPQGDLARFIHELKENPGGLEELGLNLDDLTARLAGSGVSLPDLKDPEVFKSCLEEVRGIIIPLLSRNLHPRDNKKGEP
jgi:DNA repair protein SbcD/Mre11